MTSGEVSCQSTHTPAGERKRAASGILEDVMLTVRRALVATVLLGSLAATGCNRAAEPLACPANAEPANFNFTLKDVNGTDVQLERFKGKVVFLNFWATWCVPCQAEIPILVDLYEQYQPQGFEVIGAVVLDEFSRVKPYADQAKMTYTIVDATKRTDFEEAFGPLPGLPTSFMIARDGSICTTHIGLPRPDKGERLQDRIRRTFEAEIKALL
jgi:thiol-disulfide isomerase/thioredoxin